MFRCTSRALLPLIAIVAAAWPQSVLAGAYLRAATLDPAADPTTLVMDLSAPLQPRLSTLDQPRRVVVDLPNTRRGVALNLCGDALAPAAAAFGVEQQRLDLGAAEVDADRRRLVGGAQIGLTRAACARSTRPAHRR